MHTIWRDSRHTLRLTSKEKFDAVALFTSSRQKFELVYVKSHKKKETAKNVFNLVSSFGTISGTHSIFILNFNHFHCLFVKGKIYFLIYGPIKKYFVLFCDTKVP